MLRTRLWMGAVLIALVTGVLVFDQHFAPWFPFLLVFALVLAIVGTLELVHLIDGPRRPPLWLCWVGVLGVLLANWSVALERQPWPVILGAFAALILAAFLTEMATFREPGHSVVRI